MNVLDLFSGIGCFSLGLERAGMRTVAFSEVKPFCRAVLQKHWPDVPIYGDVRELTATQLVRDGIRPSVITGGFPCQDISNAGRRGGLGGAKSGLWSEMRRLIAEIRPEWVIIENSAHGRRHYLEEILRDLSALGFQTSPMEIAAHDLGANHERRRCWILANPCSRRQRLAEEAIRARRPCAELHSWWANEPRIRRVDDGAADRVDRIEALGNAVLPQIPELIGKAIMHANITTGRNR